MTPTLPAASTIALMKKIGLENIFVVGDVGVVVGDVDVVVDDVDVVVDDVDVVVGDVGVVVGDVDVVNVDVFNDFFRFCLFCCLLN